MINGPTELNTMKYYDYQNLVNRIITDDNKKDSEGGKTTITKDGIVGNSL